MSTTTTLDLAAPERSYGDSTAVRIGLVNGFRLHIDDECTVLPLHTQRLLAFLTLTDNAFRPIPFM